MNNSLAPLRPPVSSASTKLALALSIGVLCLVTSACGLVSSKSGISPERAQLQQEVKQHVHDIYINQPVMDIDTRKSMKPPSTTEDYINACKFLDIKKALDSPNPQIRLDALTNINHRIMSIAAHLEQTINNSTNANYTTHDFCQDLDAG